MLGQKRLLLGIEITLFGSLVFGALAISGGAWPIGVAIGLLGLMVAVAGTLTPPNA